MIREQKKRELGKRYERNSRSSRTPSSLYFKQVVVFKMFIILCCYMVRTERF
jgi:hypothetical protein